MTTFTAAELAACAEREVKQRRKVYARLVERKQMTQGAADREIAMMVAIAARLNDEVAKNPQASGALL